MKGSIAGCPSCSGLLEISGYICSSCGTEIRGHFTGCPFCRMEDEDRYFCLIFLQCEGNMKDVEQVMGISYPTIKNKLLRVQKILGLSGQKDKSVRDFSLNEQKVQEQESKELSGQSQKILDALERGEIGFEKALELLKLEEPGNTERKENQ